MPMIPAGNQLSEIGECFVAAGIDRAQFDALSLERRNPARGQDFQGKIQCQRARMKQVQRPKVDGASGQIGATGGVRGDGRLQGQSGLSGHAKVVSRALPELSDVEHYSATRPLD
jgi:hypothetical protein